VVVEEEIITLAEVQAVQEEVVVQVNQLEILKQEEQEILRQ
jgi:hypothetical protein